MEKKHTMKLSGGLYFHLPVYLHSPNICKEKFSFDFLHTFSGWAATMKYNDQVRAEFAAFYERSDTFSLGVCNGCQLMALLGWVAPTQDKGKFCHFKIK